MLANLGCAHSPRGYYHCDESSYLYMSRTSITSNMQSQALAPRSFVCLFEIRVFFWKLIVGIPRTWGLLYSPCQPLRIPSAITPIGQLHSLRPQARPFKAFCLFVSWTKTRKTLLRLQLGVESNPLGVVIHWQRRKPRRAYHRQRHKPRLFVCLSEGDLVFGFWFVMQPHS